jgi:transcription initiation factor TFIIIB Brf1 subunit/transcription initiation factor TFIIB
VSVREIIRAHSDLGKRVSASSFIQLSLESPIRTVARTPTDYLSRVLARLSTSDEFQRKVGCDGVSQTGYSNSLRETAKELLKGVGAEETAGRRPCTLAASAVYSAETVLAQKEHRKKRLTQRLIAECGDAAEYTIREQCARIFVPAVERNTRRR